MEPTVFVLGAGFTKAFFEDAPLLVDDYGTGKLEEELASLKNASNLLRLERLRNGGVKINIERLMTRTDVGMPYDLKSGGNLELGLLLLKLKDCLRSRIEESEKGRTHLRDLAAIASYCVKNSITCISFNYDDFFDQALWEVEKWENLYVGPIQWHPDDGYGFFCKPAFSSVIDVKHLIGRSSMFLLKLHGSFNWYPILGQERPYPIGTILHKSNWMPLHRYPSIRLPGEEVIMRHLEPDPFIIPPVFVKSDLTEQPILRLLWALAHKKLREAKRIVFIGYSFPLTDIVSTFLFNEAISEESEIEVVNKAEGEDRKTIEDRYNLALNKIGKSLKFHFDGARAWSQNLLEEESSFGGKQDNV